MLTAELLLPLIAGYRVTGALYRWLETWRVLGIRKTLQGAALTARIRVKRPFRPASPGEIRFWLVHPTVPILFELQAAIVSFSVVAYMTYASDGFGIVLEIVRGPIAIFLFVWGLARASESVLPPCLLYLGVSEPGQYNSFRYLASSRRWLPVSAIDQANWNISEGNASMGPIGEITRLVWRSIPIVNWYLSLVAWHRISFQRRRLESIRTTDDVWEPVVRSLIEFVPLIVADLRSSSAVVNNELVWVLQSQADDRLIAVTNKDGSTALSVMMHRLRMDLQEVARCVTHPDSLNAVVASILDRLPYPQLQQPTSKPGSHAPVRLIEELIGEVNRTRSLVQDLESKPAPNADLDARIQRWAEGLVTVEVRPYTSSLWPVVDLIRRRISSASYSLWIADGGRSSWAEICVQQIGGSFRVSLSNDGHQHPALALIVALLNAELGVAVGRSDGDAPRPQLVPLLRDDAEDTYAEAMNLAGRFGFLAREISHGWRDPEAERALADFFEIPTDTFVRDDEEATTVELERVIDASGPREVCPAASAPFPTTQRGHRRQW